MRVFLSPLHLCLHACRHCVRRHYRKTPDRWWWLYELEKMPPLGNFIAGQGFVPDLSVLLMFDEFVIDGNAYERMVSKSAPAWLGEWPHVVKVLESEGSLVTVDTASEMKRLSATRGVMLKKDMRIPQRWANALKYANNLIAGADEAFSGGAYASGDLKWKIHRRNDIVLCNEDDDRFHDMGGLLRIGPIDDPDDDHYLLYKYALGNLRRHLSEVNAALALTKALDAAPMLWAPYDLYLKEKSLNSPLLQESINRKTAVSQFFCVAFPAYRPQNFADFAKLRRNKHIQQLREEIIRAARTDCVMDAKYPQSVLQQVLEIEKKAERVRKICGWLNSLIGAIPIPGFSLATTAATEVVSSKIQKRIRQDWHWFYMISNGKGYT